MELFNQTIGAGVVGSGSGTGDSKEFHHVFPKIGLKQSSSVRSEGGWDAKTCDTSKQEWLGDCFSAGVGERDDFWPTSEPVHAG